MSEERAPNVSSRAAVATSGLSRLKKLGVGVSKEGLRRFWDGCCPGASWGSSSASVLLLVLAAVGELVASVVALAALLAALALNHELSSQFE
jgi:hypothetical protein